MNFELFKNQRLEEDNREYSKKNQALMEKKFSKAEDDTAVYREKIKQKNKLIEELEDENQVKTKI